MNQTYSVDKTVLMNDAKLVLSDAQELLID